MGTNVYIFVRTYVSHLIYLHFLFMYNLTLYAEEIHFGYYRTIKIENRVISSNMTSHSLCGFTSSSLFIPIVCFPLSQIGNI